MQLYEKNKDGTGRGQVKQQTGKNQTAIQDQTYKETNKEMLEMQ